MTLDQFKAYLATIPASQRYELMERAAILEEANGWTVEVCWSFEQFRAVIDATPKAVNIT